ncbi:fungal-specific transcription factor domain-containing protein [Pestalotiopsis sp. NC0098]|nr:fungal-specific transcription factor domain-containing protein [Pestalotiopsis sp. NC0098]
MSGSGVQVNVPEWAATVPQDQDARPGKRSRVALACQRCKTRKQKCNGANPCSKCQSLGLACEYVVPQKPMPFGKNQYIKSLERRVAELETALTKFGVSDLNNDHWNLRPSPTGPDHADSTETPETDNADTADTDHEEWQDGVDNVVSVLRGLSMDANGTGYIGGSSHVTMGKLFGFLGTSNSRGSHRRVRSRNYPETDNDAEPIDFNDMLPGIPDHLLTGYMKHIATRFPVVHTPWIREVHNRRLSLTNVFERTILHLVYASAGRFLETAGEYGAFFPKRHYASALSTLGLVLDHDDIRSVSTLMLMAIYCLRNPVGPGAWTYARMAMLITINLGLHRKTAAMKRPSIENELRKRVFWSTYAFDRQISIPLGRPFAISDRDIDVPLPLDIDEDITEEGLASIPLTQTLPPDTSTSLSSFIQIVRIRRIESDIQQSIYRVDETSETSDQTVDAFLARLDHWKSLIPLDARGKKDMQGVPFDGYDVYMVYFFKCKRLLLYPQISKTPVNLRFLKECATACAGVCGAYKRLHQAMSVGYSIMALQTVFMAGLTLVYCIWISPDEIFDISTSNGIHDCSIVLFVVAERVRTAKRYRNAFEVIRQRVIDQISDGSSRQPRQTMSGLVAELAPSIQSWEPNQPFGVNDSFEQFSRIVSEMSGGLTQAGGPSEAYDNTGDLFDTLPTHMTALQPSEAAASPGLAQTFEADLNTFVGQDGLDAVFNDDMSPWFSADSTTN